MTPAARRLSIRSAARAGVVTGARLGLAPDLVCLGRLMRMAMKTRWKPAGQRSPSSGTSRPAAARPVQAGSVTGLCSAAGWPTFSGMAADLELIAAVRAALRRAAQPELARPMQAYMKSATPFLGVRVPMMRTLTRAEAKLRPFTTSADLSDTVLRLWRQAGYREERYAAITLLDTPAARRLRDPALLQTLRELIVAGAWWDYVDELAHRVGDLLLSRPAEVRPALLTWTRSDDRWLRRASIICQLGTRDQADVELLTIAIESAISDSDFFLRKAIGWALRDYARTDPAWVRSFAETHELSPLSRREALKHLS
jgi:3-methyladenine DNA glycosylase AlkD